MHRAHITRTMKIDSQFYREALKSVSIFERKKGVPDVAAWDDENIFYNPLIMNKAGKTLKETEYFRPTSDCLDWTRSGEDQVCNGMDWERFKGDIRSCGEIISCWI